nr:GHKL domain-containing protein [uncultured Acetatifactor sp.]
MSGIIETMLLCLMEVISGDVFISLFFEKRGKRNFWKTVLFGLLLSCASTINAKVLRDFLILKLAVTVLIYTIFMLFRYRAKLAKMLLVALGYIVTLSICDYIFYILIESFVLNRWNILYTYDVFITLVTVLAKTLEFLLFVWLRRIFSRDKIFYELGRKEWGRFLIFILLSVIALVFFLLDEKCGENTAVVVSFDLMFLNVFFYFSMRDIIQKSKENQEYRLMQEKARGQVKLYRNMEIAYREQRRHTHEFKNHIGCIQGLLREKKTEEALRYVEQIWKKNIEEDNSVRTGNDIIDIIVNQKLREAMKEKITFVMNLGNMENFPLKEPDTVVLLSNLLENAMEACKGIENEAERIIRLKMAQRGENFILAVSNSVNNEVRVTNHVAQTTKENKLSHGIGMGNIREIISKYGAEGECRYEEGWFVYTIVFGAGVSWR